MPHRKTHAGALPGPEEQLDLLRFSTMGNVDDGKSTLIGRLLYEASGLHADQLAAVRSDSERLGRSGIDLSLIMDGLKAEREQSITIDVAYRYFSTPRRHFIIADTPGHEQYTRNMATGASTADLAIILIDARRGVVTQSKRHAFIASLLGIKHIIVAVNKMDLVKYSESVFRRIESDFGIFAERLSLASIVSIPLSALTGDGVARKGVAMPWYAGPTLLSTLENITIPGAHNLIDLRFPIQYVVGSVRHFRGYCGQVASGVLHAGDELLVLSSQCRSRVKKIITARGEETSVFAPQSAMIILADEVDISRGDMLVHPRNLPHIEKELDAMLVWMDEHPLEAGKTYLLKHTTQLIKATAKRLLFEIDPDTLHRRAVKALPKNGIGRVELSLFRPLFCDEYTRNRATGSFILIDPASHATVAAGMVLERGKISAQARGEKATGIKSAHIRREAGVVSGADRERFLKQRPVTIWLTGLSGSGKSTIAYGLEKRLVETGHVCCVLDGDNIRHGLNRDLAFSPVDRCENIRRVAEVARLFNEAGIIAVAAFIAPYRDDRDRARKIIGDRKFVEVFVDAPLSVCEKRDAKGLYQKARSGLIADFTGITAPYEAPKKPEVHIDTTCLTSGESVDRLFNYLTTRSFLIE